MNKSLVSLGNFPLHERVHLRVLDVAQAFVVLGEQIEWVQLVAVSPERIRQLAEVEVVNLPGRRRRCLSTLRE